MERPSLRDGMSSTSPRSVTCCVRPDLRTCSSTSSQVRALLALLVLEKLGKRNHRAHGRLLDNKAADKQNVELGTGAFDAVCHAVCVAVSANVVAVATSVAGAVLLDVSCAIQAGLTCVWPLRRVDDCVGNAGGVACTQRRALAQPVLEAERDRERVVNVTAEDDRRTREAGAPCGDVLAAAKVPLLHQVDVVNHAQRGELGAQQRQHAIARAGLPRRDEVDEKARVVHRVEKVRQNEDVLGEHLHARLRVREARGDGDAVGAQLGQRRQRAHDSHLVAHGGKRLHDAHVELVGAAHGQPRDDQNRVGARRRQAVVHWQLERVHRQTLAISRVGVEVESLPC
eukprot:5672084-Pleurochrysis_carterae.AAC.2